MKKLIYIFFIFFLLSSCEKEDINGCSDRENIRQTVIIYAVNRSSLAYDFNDDLSEMMMAATKIDFSKYQLLLYKTDSETKSGLYSFSKDRDGKIGLELVKEYQRDKTSTSPERISEVIDYSLSLYPNSTYDLIFWGHGMSWKPYFTDHVVDIPNVYAYGGEYTGATDENGNKKTDWIEIDELAACIPDNVFNTIWFDCCYMSGIEVIYEFRNKCRTFIGYPSEVWSFGLAYNLILPYFFEPRHDMISAAKSFYDYYNSNSEPVTVAVVEMDMLEPMAEIARKILRGNNFGPNSDELLNYSRTASSPFYDFRQYIAETAVLNDKDEIAIDFLDTLDKMIVYHAESQLNFSLKPWKNENISGINTHYYRNGNFANEDYYQTLSWYKRIYE